MILKMLELDESNLIEINDTDNYNIKDFLDTDMKEENKGKKFDICLMNPPYARGLHLKFLEKTIEIAEKVVSVQPCGWLQDPIGKEKTSSNYLKYENSISKHIKSLDSISPIDSTNLFGGENQIQIADTLGIYVCDKNGGYDYSLDTGFPYNLYSKKETFPFKTGLYKNNKDKNFVCLISFSGCLKRGYPAVNCTNKYGVFTNGKNKNGLTFEQVKKSNSKFTVGNIDNQLVAVFNTKEEALVFYNMCTSDFWKYLCFESTKSNLINLNYLPWPSDYSKEWTERRFYEYFNLSKDDMKKYEETVSQLKKNNKFGLYSFDN